MAKRGSRMIGPSDEQVRALLERYGCPVPFHEVRTRFLGNIASPVMAASPLETVKGLWGGELPEFDDLDAVNELMGALVMGLWNRLTRHQERNAPFRLLRFEVPATREGLRRVAEVRRQELDGFIEGLFGTAESLDLPERADRALNTLAELRALFESICVLAADETKAAAPSDVAKTLRHVQELTRIGEHEIHAAVLACTRARRQLLQQRPTSKRGLH